MATFIRFPTAKGVATKTRRSVTNGDAVIDTSFGNQDLTRELVDPGTNGDPTIENADWFYLRSADEALSAFNRNAQLGLSNEMAPVPRSHSGAKKTELESSYFDADQGSMPWRYSRGQWQAGILR